jgi:hypothetical protein
VSKWKKPVHYLVESSLGSCLLLGILILHTFISSVDFHLLSIFHLPQSVQTQTQTPQKLHADNHTTGNDNACYSTPHTAMPDLERQPHIVYPAGPILVILHTTHKSIANTLVLDEDDLSSHLRAEEHAFFEPLILFLS